MILQELRIGNYLKCLDEIMEVCDILEDSFRVKDKEEIEYKNKWTNIEPIPITEEILLKLGFKNYKNGYVGIDAMGTNFILGEPNEYHHYYNWYIKQNNVPVIITLEYVHQLQNLFYSLTGKELVFKK